MKADNNLSSTPTPPAIDAKFMERWLGDGKIIELNAKTLYDLQCLIEHYKDFICAGKDVSVDYPTEENFTACASVDGNKVFIPTEVLLRGRVDDTIALMIHELRHIALSNSERDTITICYAMLSKILKSIFVGSDDEGYRSLHELVFTSPICIDEILKGGEGMSPRVSFLRKSLKDIAFLLNGVEDVRIDGTCPPNLKKYIDKLDEGCSHDFVSLYEAGEFQENNLENLAIRIVYHHKGFIHDKFIDDKLGDLDWILETDQKLSVPHTLFAFQDEIRNHIEDLWNNGDISCQEQGNGETESFLSDMLDEAGDNLGDDIGGDIEKAKEATNDIEYEEKELKAKSESMRKGEKEKEVDVVLANHKNPSLKRSGAGGEKTQMIPASFYSEIQSYKNLKVYDCEETFNNRSSAVKYQTVIIDATQGGIQ